MTSIIRRDRDFVFIGLGVLILSAWAYTFYLAVDMRSGAAMPLVRPWDVAALGALFVMWAAMMIAMMIPTATPMVLTFATINRNRQAQEAILPAWAFVFGYAIVWTGFSALATGAQGALHALSLLSPMMVSTSSILGGLLLIGAGVFQWTPFKYACLSRCRSPMGFIMSEWRQGRSGALVMGLRHGIFCLGCCWALMALLFVVGVMNLLWIAALAGFVLVEKVSPHGHWVARLSGVGLIAWGSALLVGAFA